MPRDIPVGNGRLLVTFDHQYQIRDVYFPHVGQENHAGAGPCRFGVHTDVPGKGIEQLSWTSDPGWTIHQRYLRDTLTTSVSLEHKRAQARAVLQRRGRFPSPDPRPQDQDQEPRQRRPHRPGDAPPGLQHVRHEDRRHRLLRPGAALHGPLPRQAVHPDDVLRRSGEQRIDEYATGTSGFHGAEGTWRDAEDGHLQGNAIAQGAVDSHHRAARRTVAGRRRSRPFTW